MHGYGAISAVPSGRNFSPSRHQGLCPWLILGRIATAESFNPQLNRMSGVTETLRWRFMLLGTQVFEEDSGDEEDDG
jgi:hypothetical protein